MCRIQPALKVGQGFDELARRLTRRDLFSMPCAQIADDARKEPLDRSYDLKREVCDRVPDTSHRVMHLIAHKRQEIDMLDDKRYASDALIKAFAPIRENSDPVKRLILRQGEESRKERAGDE